MKHIRIHILFVLVALLFTGCNDLFNQESDELDSGVSQVEWYPLSRTVTEPASGGASGTTAIEIQLIRTQNSSDQQVNFSVDAANSTAVAGTHYNLQTSSPATIAANTWETTVTIEILDSPLTAGQSGTLVLLLEDGNGVEAAVNLRTHTLTILGQD
jgi:hypothetical protein